MKLICKYDRIVFTFVITMLSGIICHMYMFTNYFAIHDEVGMIYGIGGTYEFGRWVLYIIAFLMRLSSGLYSMPWLNGVISVVIISASACLIVDLWEIKDKWACIICGGLMVAYPVVAGTFLYRFCTPWFFLALFSSVFSIWIVQKSKSKIALLLGIVCVVFSLGIYQAYFCVGLAVLWGTFLFLCLSRDALFLVKKGTRHLIVQSSGLIIYLIIIKWYEIFLDASLSTYQGINAITSLSVKDRLFRVYLCYANFFRMITWQSDTQGLTESFQEKTFVCLFCLVLGGTFIFYFFKKKTFVHRVFLIILAITFPIAINSIYAVTSASSTVHTLMRYSLVFIGIIATVLITKIDSETKLMMLIRKIVYILGILYIAYNIRYDNIVYLKFALLQQQTTSYYTTLISNIKGCENYRDDLPIAFIGLDNLQDATIRNNNQYYHTGIVLTDMDLRDWIINYNYIAYMRNICGFSPMLVDVKEIDEQIYIDMPCYPDYGSIKVVNDIVICKMGEYGADKEMSE